MASQDALRRALAVPSRADAVAPFAAAGSAAGALAIKSAYGPSNSTLAMIARIEKQNEKLSKLARPVTFPALERMREISESIGLSLSQTVGRPAGLVAIRDNSELVRRFGAVSAVARTRHLGAGPLAAKMNRVSEIAAIQSRAMEPTLSKFRSSLGVSTTITSVDARGRTLVPLTSAAALTVERRPVARVVDLRRSAEPDVELVPTDRTDPVVVALAERLDRIADEVADMGASVRLLVDALRDGGLVDGSDERITTDVAMVLGTYGAVNASMSTSPLQALLSGSISLAAFAAATRAESLIRRRRR